MNEFIKKLIEKLEGKKKYFQTLYECEGKTKEDANLNKATQLAFDDALEIINQLAEEYKSTLMEELIEAKRSCGEDSDCSGCIFGQIENRCILAELQNETKTKNESVKGDLISRNNLLQKFCINSDGRRIPEVDCDNHEITVSIKDIKRIIREQPTAYNDEWIPVSSGKLPEDDMDVLVKYDVERYGIAWYQKNFGWDSEDIQNSIDRLTVIAWQPIAAYQPKGE